MEFQAIFNRSGMKIKVSVNSQESVKEFLRAGVVKLKAGSYSFIHSFTYLFTHNAS